MFPKVGLSGFLTGDLAAKKSSNSGSLLLIGKEELFFPRQLTIGLLIKMQSNAKCN
jgi:hypothetical protein